MAVHDKPMVMAAGFLLILSLSPAWAGNTCISGLPATSDCTGVYTDWQNAENADVTIDSDVSGQVFGGRSIAADAVNNRVTVVSGAVRDGVYGGSGVNAADNHVVIRDTVVNQNIAGGIGLNTSTNNSIIFSGGIVNNDLIGGYGHTTWGNRVAVSGGVVNGDIIGGGNFAGTATCNTVSVSGVPTFGKDTAFYGGRCVSGTCLDVRSGNRLDLFRAVTVKAAGGFQHFGFTLSHDRVGSTMLQTREAVVLTPAGAPLAGVSISAVTGSDPMVEGDRIVLIGQVSTGPGESDFAINGGKFRVGTNDTLRNIWQYSEGRIVRVYDVRLDLSGGVLSASVVRVSEETPQ